MYYTYILECNDKTFYTWITTDLERRVNEHNFSKLWAKYTFTRRPVKIVYFETFENRSSASKEEFRIKSLSKIEKIKLIQKKEIF